MLQSEKKSLIRFITIYALLIFTLVTTVSVIYYNVHHDRIKLEYKTLMNEFATLQAKRIKWLHTHFPKYNKYPRDSRFKSAIYDTEYQEIFSEITCKEINFNKNLYYCGDSIVYLKRLSDFYLGAKYIFIEIPKNSAITKLLLQKILLSALLALTLLLILGYYLAKVFVKPMRESIFLLDNFIKDTTHEINTPISIINTNIEMLDSRKLDEKSKKYINRIKIASRTLENIYKDLKYLTLCDIESYKSQKIDLKALIKERLEYFTLHMEAKKISYTLDLEDFTIEADRKLIVRLIDNIISNAIKYNKVNGNIDITLKGALLTISDTGIGIEKDNIKDIFQRYRRFNSAEGGFGIGLNIVQNIVKMYGLKIEIESKKDIGTKVIIKW